MSQDKSTNDKLPWGQRPLSFHHLVAVAGFGLIFWVIAAGIMILALDNIPGDDLNTPPIVIHSPIEAKYPPLEILPAIPFPPDNLYSIEKAELGKMLFLIRACLVTAVSLATHAIQPAMVVGPSPVQFPLVYPGTSHWRNASTILNVAYYSKLNWDGGKLGIEDQAKGAWSSAVAGNVDLALAEERLAQIPEYVERFKQVFGTEYPLISDAYKAVAVFERTIVSQNVPFDAYLEGDDTAVSNKAKQGYELFIGKAGCIACHHDELISDDSFHNTAVPTHPGFATNNLNQITFRYEHWAKGVSERGLQHQQRRPGIVLRDQK